ncbi:alpha/beta hydrolase [Candidatus Woesearchaeota archaeon]|nr:alpha/beta hydrolase [Candidatus Woesearchaeota archaeon]
MEEGQKPIKSFWKKYELIIIAVVTLAFIYFVIFFNQKINFFLGNELIIYLSPNEKSFSMHYGDISKAEFDTSIYNFAYCRASCNYSFNDRSRNEAIDKGSFEIKIGEHVVKGYNITIKRLGSGQDFYSFDIACRSIPSVLCLTKSIEKSRSSLVTVNYDLTETEKKLKDSLKQNVTKLLFFLANVDVLQQKASQKYFELGFRVNLKSSSEDRIAFDEAYDEFVISVENLRSLWSIENYNRLNMLFNQSFFENLEAMENSIKRLDKEIEKIAELHNQLLSRLKSLDKGLKALESFEIAFENATQMDEAVSSFNDASSALTNNTFDNYSTISNDILKLEGWQGLAINDTRLMSASFFFNAGYLLKFEKNFMCSLMQNCNENMSVSDAIKDTEKFIKSYPDELQLREACNSLNELNNGHIAAKNDTLKLIENKSVVFPAGNDFLGLAARFEDNEARKINNSYHDSLEKLKLENKTDFEIIKIAEGILPKDRADIEQLQHNESINMSLYLLSKLKLSKKTLELLEKCAELGKKKSKIGKFVFEPVSMDINYTIIPRIDTNLSDNFPVCCVFNDCKPCCIEDSCRNDSKTFPVIFLHGHSLAKSNSPEFSLDAFNKLQSRLQDDGYLNAGIVSLYSKNEPAQMGIWGLSGKPITAKVSYYFDAFRKGEKYILIPTKSENIDTYALRLKDLIEIVKERTNKPKVNIIAHSMGSLVARRYVQIFGEQDIDKLIMIAAPNKGVAGAIGDYCGFVGESRECNDMQENSLFLNKLNDPANQPKEIKVYTIIGQGCQMKFGDGDGIATVESANLENSKSYRINGTCGGLFGEVLHTAILDIDKYPKTYETIREILKE